MSFTTCRPIWMAISSDEAQYLPSRYSSTNTGTLAPTLTLRTRSLRTHLAREDPVDLVVEERRAPVAARSLMVRSPRSTGISPDWASTASVAGSSTTMRTESHSSRRASGRCWPRMLGVSCRRRCRGRALAPMAMPAWPTCSPIRQQHHPQGHRQRPRRASPARSKRTPKVRLVMASGSP